MNKEVNIYSKVCEQCNQKYNTEKIKKRFCLECTKNRRKRKRICKLCKGNIIGKKQYCEPCRKIRRAMTKQKYNKKYYKSKKIKNKTTIINIDKNIETIIIKRKI